jgi:twitching motility protein PilJ
VPQRVTTMEKRPYSKSLRGKITNRTLFIGIVPVLLVGVFAWFSLNQLTSSANQQLDKSRSELLDSVVGSNLSTTSARIVSQLDAFMLERISDVVVWASAPIIIQAAKAAAEAHQSIDEIEARFKKRKSLNVSPAANRFLIQQIRRSTHFGEVFFTDKHGFNTALTNPTSDFVQRDENWWKTAWENGISVGEVEFDDSAGIWSIDISVYSRRHGYRAQQRRAVTGRDRHQTRQETHHGGYGEHARQRRPGDPGSILGAQQGLRAGNG